MKGFAPFSVFVGIVMLGISIAIASNIQSQINAYTNQMQQREAQIQSAYNTSMFSLDSITTFAQALRAALYSQDYTYTTSLSDLDKSLIKDAASDFITALTQTEMYVSGAILTTSSLSNTEKAIHDATTVEEDPDRDLIIVKIRPHDSAIPLAEMNIYDNKEAYTDNTPTSQVVYPLFPLEANTFIYAYVPLKEIQNSINDVTNKFSDVEMLVGFVSKKNGIPSLVVMENGSEKYDYPWTDGFLKVNDKNYPLRDVIQLSPVSQDVEGSYIPSTLTNKIEDAVKKIIGSEYTLAGSVTVKYSDAADVKMPFKKLVCFTGKFAKALVADPEHDYTVCVDITDGDAVEKEVKKEDLGSDGAGGKYIKLPYKYVKHISLTMQKTFTNTCIPGGGSISPKMHVDADLKDGTPPNTPKSIHINQNTVLEWAYPSDAIMSSIYHSDYDLEWAQGGCQWGELQVPGPASCSSSTDSQGNCTGCTCTGPLKSDCSGVDSQREGCWQSLANDVKKCNSWVYDKGLYGYVTKDGSEFCGASVPPQVPNSCSEGGCTDICAENYRWCQYCASVNWDPAICCDPNTSQCYLWWEQQTCENCESECYDACEACIHRPDSPSCNDCSTGTYFVRENPYEWWNGRSGDFLDTSNYAFIFNVENARDAVKEWINMQFLGQCEKVLDGKICDDLLRILDNYTDSDDVYVLSNTSDPESIAKTLIQSGGGLLSITVVDTEKFDPNRGEAKWKATSAAVVYCNNPGNCTTVASSP